MADSDNHQCLGTIVARLRAVALSATAQQGDSPAGELNASTAQRCVFWRSGSARGCVTVRRRRACCVVLLCCCVVPSADGQSRRTMATGGAPRDTPIKSGKSYRVTFRKTFYAKSPPAKTDLQRKKSTEDINGSAMAPSSTDAAPTELISTSSMAIPPSPTLRASSGGSDCSMALSNGADVRPTEAPESPPTEQPQETLASKVSLHPVSAQPVGEATLVPPEPMHLESMLPGPSSPTPSGINSLLPCTDAEPVAPPALDMPTAPDDPADAARDLDGTTYVEAPILVLPPECELPPIVSDEEDPFQAEEGPVAEIGATLRAPATMAEASSAGAICPELVARDAESSHESAQPGVWLDNLKAFWGKYVTEFKNHLSESVLPKASADVNSDAHTASFDPMGAYAQDFRAKWHARRTNYRAHLHVAMAGCGGKETPGYWLRQRVLA